MERIVEICDVVFRCLCIICMFKVIDIIACFKKNVIEQMAFNEKNAIGVNVTFSPITIEDKRNLDNDQKNSACLNETEEEKIQENNGGMDLSDQSSNVENIPQPSQPVPKSEKREEFLIIDKWISEANMVIAQKGYAEWIEDRGQRIGTGDGPQDVGDKVTLKIGKGNMRVTKCAGVICGVPGKAQWKECDFKSGAYYECYQMPEGIDSDSDYEVTKIKECAILTQEKDMFHVVRKGTIEVKRL